MSSNQKQPQGDSPVDSIIEALSLVVQSWIKVNDGTYFETVTEEELNDKIQELFDEITKFLKACRCTLNILPVAVLYADRFVNDYGIKHDQVFNIVLISCLVSMKFWGDYLINNSEIAGYFGYENQEINTMELRFLRGLDFHFMITPSDLSSFVFKAAQAKLPQQARFYANSHEMKPRTCRVEHG